MLTYLLEPKSKSNYDNSKNSYTQGCYTYFEGSKSEPENFCIVAILSSSLPVIFDISMLPCQNKELSKLKTISYS